MKAFILAAIAALTVSAAPAVAQDFTGPRIGATVGYDTTHDRDGVAYGGTAGYDTGFGVISPKATLGGEVTFGDSTASFRGINVSRDIAASARLGYVIAPRLLMFGKVGYATTRFEYLGAHTNLEGVRYGGGLELATSRNTYLSAEFRRTSYENHFGGRNQALGGVGFRF